MNSDLANTDFREALDIYENKYCHSYLIEILKVGTIAQKQAACIMLDGINNYNDAKVFISNLTGCDGKIREAVSFRLTEFVKHNPEYFIEFYDIFLDAVTDINGNICRNTISAISNLTDYKEFVQKFCDKLTENTLNLAQKAKDFDIQEGKYKINKEIFKLYWYLETICTFVKFINKQKLKQIFLCTILVQDYTIREKSAKILSLIDDNSFDDIKKQLENDNNYYVKRALKNDYHLNK